MGTIAAPTIGYALLLPFIVIFAAACVGILVEAIVPRDLRRAAQLLLAFVAVGVALVVTISNWSAGGDVVVGVASVAVDGPTSFIWTILLVFGAVSFGMFAERKVTAGVSAFAPMAAAVPGTVAEREAIEDRREHTEVLPLALFALSGMMLFPAANDLITMFVALEILSLPLYLLCGLARRRRLLSQEAAMKYFLLGALSSAFFLYGAALLYGYSGSFLLSGIDDAIRNGVAGTGPQGTGLLLAGMGLMAVGLLFKFGAVPFHSWTPDVYTGAPTPVTAFMAACTKIAAIGALMRVFYVALGSDRWDWQPLMAVVAIATMVVGSVLAITQTDVKRMLAYSSIAHAGFILTAFVGASQAATGAREGQLTSVSSVMFYLVAYGAATIGAFAIVTMVRDSTGEATQLSSWVGLGKRSPAVALVFSVFLLSFAGIPLTSGFIGKWSVFASAWSGGLHWLVVVAVVVSVVAAFFYIRVIVMMFFTDQPVEATGAGTAGAEVVRPGWTTLLAVGVGVAATVVFGIYPGPLLGLAQQASEFIR
ncbi:NADH-quinone oxidoreductase subunit NuoN [Microlunatus flavus]|uniref:NADH-quinone oxidoreductase subunit N n=1 Tax=Microlunatus flavus TaxID=1036181 RepID=A0A1H9LWT2_9ACTN|nr:NADH-quinone oxidoreductase subunit NuoN [Microlunatus flavus]SER15655.1 NADH-quinone oxidoreductase subunit N [Microlunatus flavus]